MMYFTNNTEKEELEESIHMCGYASYVVCG